MESQNEFWKYCLTEDNSFVLKLDFITKEFLLWHKPKGHYLPLLLTSTGIRFCQPRHSMAKAIHTQSRLKNN